MINHGCRALLRRSRLLFGLPFTYHEVDNDHKCSDKKIHENTNHAFETEVSLMPGHELAVIPVLGNPPGIYHLSS